METSVWQDGTAHRGGSDDGPETKLRAAEYVRMSTEHQKYSTENQAEAIRRYASARSFTIVRTYGGARDDAEGAYRANERRVCSTSNDAPGHNGVRLSFERESIVVPIVQLVPLRVLRAGAKESKKYTQTRTR